MTVARYLQPDVLADLGAKMVFVEGPARWGRPRSPRALEADAGVYLNWDNSRDRREIRVAHWPATPALVVLDEVHKWRAWKRWLRARTTRTASACVSSSWVRPGHNQRWRLAPGRYHHYRPIPSDWPSSPRRTQAAPVRTGARDWRRPWAREPITSGAGLRGRGFPAAPPRPVGAHASALAARPARAVLPRGRPLHPRHRPRPLDRAVRRRAAGARGFAALAERAAGGPRGEPSGGRSPLD